MPLHCHGWRSSTRSAKSSRNGASIFRKETIGPDGIGLTGRGQGGDAPSPMSAADVQAQFDGTRKLVEQVIALLGLEPAAVLSKESEAAVAWGIKRGSAAILVTVFNNDRGDTVSLRAVSPVMTLPAGDRSALYQRLLELNGQGLVNAAFGVVGERIVVKSERPAAWLEAAEVEQIIMQLSAVADTYDDRLVREFGGERASDLAG